MSTNGFTDKPRLSEEAKKSNHIASEQKRREAIREGFDRLCELVPNMEGQGRSEAIVLEATITFMAAEIQKKLELQARAHDLKVSDGDFQHLYVSSAHTNHGSKH